MTCQKNKNKFMSKEYAEQVGYNFSNNVFSQSTPKTERLTKLYNEKRKREQEKEAKEREEFNKRKNPSEMSDAEIEAEMKELNSFDFSKSTLTTTDTPLQIICQCQMTNWVGSPPVCECKAPYSVSITNDNLKPFKIN